MTEDGSAQRTGCLLFALPRALLSRARPALSQGVSLPHFPADRFHREDLPALVRARRSAEACRGWLYGKTHDISPVVIDGVAREVAGLTSRIYDIGIRLAEGRAFLVEHSADQLAHERAELELRRLEAHAHQLVELKRAHDALERRASLVGQVEAEVSRLSARLVSAAAELSELGARLGSLVGSEDLDHELRAYQRSAELALEAFAATWKELELHR